MREMRQSRTSEVVGPPRRSPRVFLFSEARLHLGADGRVRAIDAANGPAAWARHSEQLEGAWLAARVGPPDPDAQVSMAGLLVHSLPYFHRPGQLVRRSPAVTRALWAAVGAADFSILRLPGAISLGAGSIARLRRRPYAVEVVGDPVTLLASGAVGPVGKVLAPLSGALMRWVVRGASLGRYVTAQTLQRHYPLRTGAASHYYSSVALRSEDFLQAPRQFLAPARHMIAVGTQDQMYKGHDDLLRALALMPHDGGYTVSLVGDGRCHGQLQDLARDLGISDRVRFVGRVNDRGRLWQELDAADLFVQPSRTEGLPRTLIEAMARGLPALGTDVGGIPELLPARYLVPAGRPDRLADALHRLAESPVELSSASREALERAADFDGANQEERVQGWLNAVQDVVEGANP